MVTKAEREKLAEIPQVNPQKRYNYFLYVVVFALVGMVTAGSIIVLRPDSDPVVVIGVVGGLVTSITFALLGFLKADESHAQSKETYHLVNSRMELAMKDAVKSAYGLGLEEGRKRANTRTDNLEKKKRK
jgi:hypothetical protein